jgi:hypothetical protein
MWPAADLDDPGTGGDADLLEEPPTLVRQLLRLLLQTLLLCASISKHVLVGCGQGVYFFFRFRLLVSSRIIARERGTHRPTRVA